MAPVRFLVVSYSVYLLSYPHFASVYVAGVSLVFLRDLIYLYVLFFLFLVVAVNSRRIVAGRSLGVALAVFIALSGATVSSSQGVIWEYSLPMLVRVLLLAMLALNFSFLRVSRDDAAWSFKVFYRTLFVYCSASLVLALTKWGWAGNGGIEGIAGQHFSKFIFCLSTLYAIAVAKEKKRAGLPVGRFDVVFIAVSLGCLFLVLQRGAILAVMAGFAFIFIFGRGIKAPLYGAAILLVISGFGYVLLNNERFVNYAFHENAGPGVIVRSIVEGEFTLDMIRSRGRLEMAEYILSEIDLKPWGYGAGYAKSLVSAGFDRIEPHNDFLLLLADFGLVGIVLWIVWVFSGVAFGKAVIVYRGPRSLEVRTLFLAGGGAIVGFFVWMPASNVLVYLPYNFLPAFMMTILASSVSACRPKNKRVLA